MKQTKIFEYAIFWQPNAEEAKKGKKARMLIDPVTILDNDENNVKIHAARKIPDDYLDHLDQITIAVRPF